MKVFLNNKLLCSNILVYLLFGLALIFYSSYGKTPTEDLLIWDIQWLRAYVLLFFLTLIVTWKSELPNKAKYLTILGSFSFFFIVANSLIFDGTPFGYNGFWGDQKFRQAMILKFIEFFPPTDFYYKGLPPFYPPFYYFILGTIAKLFSIEAYKMLRIGTFLIYLVGPLLLFTFWSKIVNKLQAMSITLFTFLYFSVAPHILFVAPHEFLAAVFFVPWWISFVEQFNCKIGGWKYYFIGGLIGGSIFMTYYYPFFIGGLYLVIRSVIPASKKIIGNPKIVISRSWLILGASAVFSSPYWLPLIISMIQHGSDPAQQEWFHKAYALALPEFLVFNLVGLAFLSSLIYSLRNHFKPIHRQIVSFVAVILIFFIVGNILGNLAKPILYIKANEFLLAIAGLSVGMGAASFLRIRDRLRKVNIGSLLVVAVLFFMLVDFSRFVDNKMVTVARESWVYHWNTDRAEMDQRKGKVFLNSYDAFPSFYPVYSFIANNEHYSHHASRFKERYYFLTHLQYVKDPYLFSRALRDNVFDGVNFFMPKPENNNLVIPVNWSSYPNRYKSRKLQYSTNLVADSTLFMKCKGDHLYEVLQTETPPSAQWEYAGESEDSLLHLYRIKLLSDKLTISGQEKIAEYMNEDWVGWKELNISEKGFSVHPDIGSTPVYRVKTDDSIHVMLGFVALRDFRWDYKVYLHLLESNEFVNLDFSPVPKTSVWKTGDVILLKRSYASEVENIKIEYGLFINDLKLKPGFMSE